MIKIRGSRSISCRIGRGPALPIFEEISTRLIGTPAATFWVFSFVCVLSLIFGLTIMPETRGRTLEEIAGSLKRE